MSHRYSKKARQYYRREMQQEARDIGKMIGNAMKPKPRFIPMWAWMILVRLVIKVKK